MVSKNQRWFIPAECWNHVVRKMPIPCVDTIVHRDDRVLLGFRTIPPYRGVWALLGGRMRYGESFEDTAIRNCEESGLKIEPPRYLGVFPVRFPNGRHDLAFCMTARCRSGQPRPTREIARYIWVMERDLTRIRVGANYLKMLQKWRSRDERKSAKKHRLG